MTDDLTPQSSDQLRNFYADLERTIAGHKQDILDGTGIKAGHEEAIANNLAMMARITEILKQRPDGGTGHNCPPGEIWSEISQACVPNL